MGFRVCEASLSGLSHSSCLYPTRDGCPRGCVHNWGLSSSCSWEGSGGSSSLLLPHGSCALRLLHSEDGPSGPARQQPQVCDLALVGSHAYIFLCEFQLHGSHPPGLYSAWVWARRCPVSPASHHQVVFQGTGALELYCAPLATWWRPESMTRDCFL